MRRSFGRSPYLSLLVLGLAASSLGILPIARAGEVSPTTVVADWNREAPRAERFSSTPGGSTDNRVTIRFSYYVNDLDVADRPESEASCSLTLPRGSNGVEVLRAAVSQDCIQSFSTVREDGVQWLHCINYWCEGLTNSPGIVPDTAWTVDWTGDGGNWQYSDYSRSGLKGYFASDRDWFDCRLGLVN